MRSEAQVLGVISEWRGSMTGPSLRGLMAWEILGRLEGVAVGGPLESSVLNDLMARADLEVVPALRELARQHLITFEPQGRAVF